LLLLDFYVIGFAVAAGSVAAPGLVPFDPGNVKLKSLAKSTMLPFLPHAKQLNPPDCELNEKLGWLSSWYLQVA
jgi:hypothetical protein